MYLTIAQFGGSLNIAAHANNYKILTGIVNMCPLDITQRNRVTVSLYNFPAFRDLMLVLNKINDELMT